MLTQYDKQDYEKYEKMVAQLKKEVAQGIRPENAITLLHDKGFTITQSMKILKTVYGISLGEAKEFVSNHPVWESVVTATQPLHDELITIFSSFHADVTH